MKFLGRYLNDLLELQGDGRPMDEDRFYMVEYPSMQFVPLEQWFENFDIAIKKAVESYDKDKDECIK